MEININTPTYTDFEQAEDVLMDMELTLLPTNVFQYTDGSHDNTFATKIGMPGANRVLDRPQDLRQTPRWNMFRDIIEDLYIRQELKLSRLREIMEEHHQFYAT
jgi:Clr5 domain